MESSRLGAALSRDAGSNGVESAMPVEVPTGCDSHAAITEQNTVLTTFDLNAKLAGKDLKHCPVLMGSAFDVNGDFRLAIMVSALLLIAKLLVNNLLPSHSEKAVVENGIVEKLY